MLFREHPYLRDIPPTLSSPSKPFGDPTGPLGDPTRKFGNPIEPFVDHIGHVRVMTWSCDDFLCCTGGQDFWHGRTDRGTKRRTEKDVPRVSCKTKNAVIEKNLFSKILLIYIACVMRHLLWPQFLKPENILCGNIFEKHTLPEVELCSPIIKEYRTLPSPIQLMQ